MRTWGDVEPIIMSIHPEHAANIFQGDKTYEIRRGCRHIFEGEIVMLYETAPVQEITGGFVAGAAVYRRVHRGHRHDALWDEIASGAGVSRAAFDRYLSGATKATAIPVVAPIKMSSPVPLMMGVRPPQSFLRYKCRALEDIVGRERAQEFRIGWQDLVAASQIAF